MMTTQYSGTLLMSISALLGLLFIEIYAVQRRSNEDNFSLRTYVRKNLALLALDLVGTIYLLVMAPALFLLLRMYVLSDIAEPEIRAAAELILPLITGGLIGLVGAWSLRRFVAYMKRILGGLFGGSGNNDSDA